jgi:hypothetical protein
VYLDEAQLRELFTPFFKIIDDFCEKQSSDSWKDRVIKVWNQRMVKIDVIE